MMFVNFSSPIDAMLNTTSPGGAQGLIGYHNTSTVFPGMPSAIDDPDQYNVDGDGAEISSPVSNSNESFYKSPMAVQCRLVEFYLTTLISGTLCLVGLIGTALSFVGLRRDPSMSPAASFILRSLACADAVLLSSWLIAMSIPAMLAYFDVDLSLSAVGVILYRVVGHWMLFCGQMSVAWLTVLVAAGRWATIRYPFHAAGPIRPMNVIRGAVTAVIIASVVFNIPRLFREEMGDRWGTVDQRNITQYRLTATSLSASYSYRFIYANVLYSLVNFGIPYILLTIFSVLLLVAYHTQCRRREAMLSPKNHQNKHVEGGSGSSSGRQDNEHSTTLVVVAVVVTFGICNLPAKIMQLMASQSLSMGCVHPMYIIRRLFNILELANSLGNFIVYCALRRQFRQALLIGSRLSATARTPSPRRPEQLHLAHTAISHLHDDGRHVQTTVF